MRIALLVGLLSFLGCADTSAPPDDGSMPVQESAPWNDAEKGVFSDWVQLTFSNRFVKAGESYFSPDDSKIIFQAVEKPTDGATPDEFYAMFVADVGREAANGRINGLKSIKRLSPLRSANTCGWFHPSKPDTVIFASTIVPPSDQSAPGYQRGTGKYKWMFPPEMRIVECDISKADGTAATLTTLVGDGKAYRAEGSFSPDGRHLLYCSLESGEGDLFVKDMQGGRTNRIVSARGYDGGPFFSPDGKRICYRSDRNNDNLLQLFVADLAFNETGEIVGIEREYQLTDETCVNWCPFWTHDGRRLVYASSTLGESNFEVFMVDADPGNLPGSNGTIRYGTAKRRLTQFDRADVLPAFSHDGKWMIWTSRRGSDGEVHLWTAKFKLDPDAPWKVFQPTAPPANTMEGRIDVTDPETGRIFVYDLSTHKLSEYNPTTHKLSEVASAADIELFRKLHEAKKAKGK